MSTNHTPEYVEIGCRLYEVRVVPGPVVAKNGAHALALVDHDEQLIRLDASVPLPDRAGLLNEAVTSAIRTGWQLVPVVGAVS